MKKSGLTLAYIKNALAGDARFGVDAIEVLSEGQVAVWCEPDFSWNPLDGNRTVEHFSITDGWNPRSTVDEFNEVLKMIQPAM